MLLITSCQYYAAVPAAMVKSQGQGVSHHIRREEKTGENMAGREEWENLAGMWLKHQMTMATAAVAPYYYMIIFFPSRV